MAAEPAADGGAEDDARRSGLLIDWGGVLTSNLFASFRDYCLRVEIDPQALRGRFGSDPEFRELLIALEKGELEEAAFEQRLAPLLGVESDGLIDGLFAGVHPDVAMVEAVRRARAAGVRTALVSNSWGVHRYPHDLFDELFDGVVISGEELTRAPRAGVRATSGDLRSGPDAGRRSRDARSITPAPSRRSRSSSGCSASICTPTSSADAGSRRRRNANSCRSSDDC